MVQQKTKPTPHLTISSTSPLQVLEKKLISKEQDIENWFKEQWLMTPAPVYGSVDLRNSGFKLAPIDMNLFPAGFNNLNPEFLSIAVESAKMAITRLVSPAKKILLLPESHTRNLFYWDNVQALLQILKQAGFDVRVGTLLPEFEVPSEITTQSNTKIQIESIVREDDKIGIKDFIPDLILLNNDLSDGIPSILHNLQQPIVPPAELGWSQRLKSEHFQYYQQISDEFAHLLEIDPWFIAPLFRHCGEINFMKREGEDCLIFHVEQLFAAIEEKYSKYDIQCKPFIIIKADAGTYGMAVMTVRSVDEVKLLNRKQRTAMSKSKGGRPVQRVIVQEGVYTFETVGVHNAVAEPVVYLWGQCVVGGFYRVHKERGIDENLNSPGMQFEPLAFAMPCQKSLSNSASQNDAQNRYYAYGVIARLSMLAAAREMSEQKMRPQ